MGAVTVTVGGRTDRGVTRAENQDCFLVLDLADPDTALAPCAEGGSPAPAPLDFVLGERGAVLLVADGMGGRAGGARASSLAMEAVRAAMLDGDEWAPGPSEFARRLKRSLELANTRIHEGGRGGPHAGMGSTATLAGLLDGHVYVAQVGDSRAYLVRSNRMGRLTRDQSLVQDLIDAGVLDENDTGGVSRNMILQALGPTPAVDPAVTYHELRRGDVLLLCSDGLSGVVTDDEICDAVEGTEDMSTLCATLVDLANERGGPDNITVVAARMDGELPEPGAGDEVTRKSYDGGG